MLGMKSFLEGFEKLAYDVLLWLILVPKTLYKVVTNPSWVPDYVAKELADNEKARFDDFISPVILLLLASIVPFAIFNTSPVPGVNLEGPVQGVVDTPYEFKAKGDFILASGDPGNIEDVDLEAKPSYTFSWSTGISEEQQEAVGQPRRFEWEDDKPGNSIQITWPNTGRYVVEVTADNGRGEVYSVFHPIEIVEAGTPVDATPVQLDATQPSGPSSLNTLAKNLQGEGSILAALVFLSIPLLFSLAIEMFRGRSIGGDSLKQTFYIQCYYFSPLILSLWALILLGLYFWVFELHDGIFFFTFFLTLGVLGWFLVNEIGLIARTRATSTMRATGIFLLCIFLITFAGLLVLILAVDPDFLRAFVWQGYVVATSAVFAVGLWGRFRRRKPESK